MSDVGIILFNQLVTMAIFMLVGYIVIRTGLFNFESASHLTNLLIYVITPLLTLSCFNLEYSPQDSRLFLLAVGIAAAMYIVSIFLSYAAKIGGDPEVLPTERFGIIFGNIGFIGTPLTIHLLGTRGGFYNIALCVAMNSMMFSYGRVLLGRAERIERKRDYLKLFNQPFFYALGLGLVMYFTGLHFPYIIQNSVDTLGSLTSPVAMICCGMYMAQGNALKGFLKPRLYFLCFMRLILIPFLMLLVLYLLPLERTMSLVLMVAACTSMASMTIFYSNDTPARLERSMEFFVVSLLLSIVTMPLIVGFAATLF